MLRVMNKIILTLALAALVNAQYEGQPCIRKTDNARGTCRQFYDCQKAVEDYKQKIYPQFCSNNGKNSVVCCVQQISQRISEQKCQQYSRLTRQVTSFAGLSLASTLSNQQDVENFKCVLSTALIVGGEKAQPAEFPHMAAVGWRNLDGNYDFDCGGSLISERFVLTAAHCGLTRNGPPVIVRLGDQNLRSKNDGVKEVDYPIEQFIRHEQYDPRSKKNDIGLIKLRYNVQWEDNIRPACLWQSPYIESPKTIATGFGKTSYSSSQSDELLKVQLDIINTKDCGDIKLDPTQICAGSYGDGQTGDTCQGDSGGPLQITKGNNKCIYHIVGITSYGTPYCGFAPAVYTKVSSYIDWIERKVW